MSYPKTLKGKIKYRITRSKDFVFLIKDFWDLSGRNQILHALRELIADEILVKIGKGLYVKRSDLHLSMDKLFLLKI